MNSAVLTSSDSDVQEDFGDYLAGKRLYGDDFSTEEIAQWYRDEEEGYAELGAKSSDTYRYVYHALNALHGFRRLPKRRFAHALGFGSAYGDEFKPIADRVDWLTIIDPSSAFVKTEAHGIPVDYVKPQPSGDLGFRDGQFDLIVCLGVLHHIPNVSHVVSELARCLQPGGFALVREPVVSMGDWRQPRRGLTRHERGIPAALLRDIVGRAGLAVHSERKCCVPVVSRLWNKLGGTPYNSPVATRLDALLARMLGWNLQYHATSLLGKVRPVSLYLVLTKPL